MLSFASLFALRTDTWLNNESLVHVTLRARLRLWGALGQELFEGPSLPIRRFFFSNYNKHFKSLSLCITQILFFFSVCDVE